MYFSPASTDISLSLFVELYLHRLWPHNNGTGINCLLEVPKIKEFVSMSKSTIPYKKSTVVLASARFRIPALKRWYQMSEQLVMTDFLIKRKAEEICINEM